MCCCFARWDVLLKCSTLLQYWHPCQRCVNSPKIKSYSPQLIVTMDSISILFLPPRLCFSKDLLQVFLLLRSGNWDDHGRRPNLYVLNHFCADSVRYVKSLQRSWFRLKFLMSLWCSALLTMSGERKGQFCFLASLKNNPLASRYVRWLLWRPRSRAPSCVFWKFWHMKSGWIVLNTAEKSILFIFLSLQSAHLFPLDVSSAAHTQYFGFMTKLVWITLILNTRSVTVCKCASDIYLFIFLL